MSAPYPFADWIAADWGTSHLRLWAMGPEGAVLERARSDAGMGRIGRDDYEAELLRLIGHRLAPGRATPVIVCGMAGSRQGWAEAPYALAPCPPPGIAEATRAPARDTRLAVYILPGVRQSRPQADVMRGEETQIAGLLARLPGFDGIACLPGTHTKWVHLSAGEIVSFTTAMTGELYALLSTKSVLRHALDAEGWDDTAFAEAMAETIARPERLATRLFTIRAEALTAGLSPAAARGCLSGLLIGAELAATRPWWLGQRVAIIGAAKLSRVYAQALAAQGVEAERFDDEEMTLAGLTRARQSLTEKVT
jgi:2-dehydro-3-deoxygalactonokinase